MSTEPERGTEEYTVLLERRIKAQREHIKSLIELREIPGDRKARHRIEHLEGALGRASLKLEEQKQAIAWLRDRLRELGAEPPPRSLPKIHVP